MDAHVQHAIEIGERNAETIELIAAHCRNARVELGGGWSMVDGMTGLPISARSVACDYAAVPSGGSVNLELPASPVHLSAARSPRSAVAQRSRVPPHATLASLTDRARLSGADRAAAGLAH